MRIAGRAMVGLAVAAWSVLLAAGVASAYGGGGSGTPTPTPTPNLGNTNGGNPAPLILGTTTPAPGSTDTVSSSFGPCSAGQTVSLEMLHVVPGGELDVVGTATTNAQGGLNPATFTVPAKAAPGGYVLFAECTGPNGSQVLDVALVVEGANTASAGTVVLGNGGVTPTQLAAVFAAQDPVGTPAWTPPVSWGTPAARQVVAQAVNGTVQRIVQSAGSAAPAAGAPGAGAVAPNPPANHGALAAGALVASPAVRSPGSPLLMILTLVGLALIAALGVFTAVHRRRLPPA